MQHIMNRSAEHAGEERGFPFMSVREIRASAKSRACVGFTCHSMEDVVRVALRWQVGVGSVYEPSSRKVLWGQASAGERAVR